MVLYSAVSSPLDRSKRFTLSSPGRPVHSDTVLGFSWKHSSHAAAIAQRLFTHISTTVYSQVLIYTAESKRKKIPKLRNDNNRDSNPGSLDCESGILPNELPRSTNIVVHSNQRVHQQQQFVTLTRGRACLEADRVGTVRENPREKYNLWKLHGFSLQGCHLPTSRMNVDLGTVCAQARCIGYMAWVFI